MDVKELTSLDITAPEHGVQVIIRSDSKVIWVNVDGICRLRICQIPTLDVADSRKKDDKKLRSELLDELLKGNKQQ